MANTLPARQRTAAIRSLAEDTRAHPKNEIRPRTPRPPNGMKPARYTIKGSFPRLYLGTQTGAEEASANQKAFKRKGREESRQEREEERCYSTQ